MRKWDIALVEQNDQVVVHVADCREVRALAALGVPVATMLGCQGLPDDLPYASCLREAIIKRGA